MPHFEERFIVNASPETVWAFLLDPERLAPCIPGCEDLEVVDDHTYRLRLTVKVGFLSRGRTCAWRSWRQIRRAGLSRRGEARTAASAAASSCAIRSSSRRPPTVPPPSPTRATSPYSAAWARSVTP